MTKKKFIIATIVNFLNLKINIKRGPLRACAKTAIFLLEDYIQISLAFDVTVHVVSGNQNRKINTVFIIEQLLQSASNSILVLSSSSLILPLLTNYKPEIAFGVPSRVEGTSHCKNYFFIEYQESSI